MLEGRNNGGTFCTSMLKNIFENTATNKQLKFEKPKGIVEVVLDKNSLEKNHSLLLANPETPDRYTTTASFNKKYMPTNYAEKFEIDNICKITVDLENFNPKIKFNAIKNAKYKLYRIEEDNRKLIQEFENISGETEHIDKTSKSDTTYIYYMEITLKGEEKVIKSNSEKITTPARERGTIKKLFDLW